MNELWQKTLILQQLLIQQKILKPSPKNLTVLKRPSNWKSKCSEEILNNIQDLSKQYQNEIEFWYCISHNLNPFTDEFICPLCKTYRLKFVGRHGSKFEGAYNSTCCNCSANAVEAKKERTRQTISSHSNEFKKEIKEKCNQTRLEHFGDPNYGLYGSKSFKQNLKDKYGSETYNNREKCKQTNLERYGVEWNTQLEEFKEQSLATKIENYGCGNNVEKIKQTCIDKYGVEFYVQSDEFKEKAKNTTIKNFGSVEDSYKYRQDKSKETRLLRYGDENYSNTQQAISTRNNRARQFAKDNNLIQVKDIVSKYGQGWLSLNIPRLYFNEKAFVKVDYLKEIEKYTAENHSITKSLIEIEIQEYIKSLCSNVICNTKLIISPLELDCYIPDLNLAFEINGTYWHSINVGTNKYYHLKKTLLCQKQNITLIHIFEDEWKLNKDFCKDLIKNTINHNQIYDDTMIINRCHYYPQKNFNIYKATLPRAFYFLKGSLNRIYVSNENIDDLLNKNYLVCYDCGTIKLKKETLIC